MNNKIKKQEIQWTAVKQSLPEESCLVIIRVMVENNLDVKLPDGMEPDTLDKNYVSIAFYDMRGKIFITTDKKPEFWMDEGTGGATAYITGAVSHWMKLPKFNEKEYHFTRKFSKYYNVTNFRSN